MRQSKNYPERFYFSDKEIQKILLADIFAKTKQRIATNVWKEYMKSLDNGTDPSFQPFGPGETDGIPRGYEHLVEV